MLIQPHTKSRNGCARCKRRRVKCDEQKPCGNCTRRNEECDPVKPNRIPKCPDCAARESTISSPASVGGPGGHGSSQLDSPSDWSRDMYLMYHYSAFACKEFATNEIISQLWQNVVVQLALKHPFLMHGILAISAMHLADGEPGSTAEFLPLSIHHQNLAISSFSHQLSHVTEDNCHALLAQATIISMSSRIFSCIKSRTDSFYEPSLEDLIQPYLLTRGVGEVVAAGKPWLRNGPMAQLLDGHDIPDLGLVQLPVSSLLHFENLRKHFQNTVKNEKDLTALLRAMTVLERICQEISILQQDVVQRPGVVWKWPNLTPTEYSQLLQQHNQEALLLYANFVVLSDVYKGFWFFRDWGSQAGASIAAALPMEVQSMIHYPDFLREKSDTI